MRASYRETRSAFDLPSKADVNNNTLIYQHTKSCMHTNINLNTHFPESFSTQTITHTQSQTELL